MVERREEFLENNPHLVSFVGFLDDFNRETDRGAALAAAAMIDDQLSKIVEAFLIPNSGSKELLKDKYGPLSSLDARSAAAFAMGLISEREYRDCTLIRKVRNEFAHKVSVTFATDRVVSLCAELSMAAKPYGDVKVDTRGKFTSAAVALILNLTNRPHYVGRHRLEARTWPY